jgi:phosphohistidine swiveling domain-containing protein
MLSREYVEKTDWACWYTRKLSLQKAIAFCLSIGEPSEKLVGCNIYDNAVVFNGDVGEGYSSMESILSVKEKALELVSDAAFRSKFFPAAEAAFERVLSLVQSFKEEELAKMSDKELAALYEDFTEAELESTAFLWFGVIAEEPVSEHAMRIAESAGASQFFDKVVAPSRPTYVAREKMDLLKLASLAKAKQLAPSQLDRLLEEHAAKWSFVPMYDFSYEPYSKKEFASRLAESKDPDGELEEMIQAGRRNAECTAAALSSPGLSVSDADFLKFAKEFAYFKEYRNEVRTRSSFHARLLYKEIGGRMGFTLADVLQLTNREIMDFLIDGVNSDRSEVQRRKSGYVLLQTGSEYAVISGDGCGDLARSFSKKPLSSTVEGIGASQGKARGAVKVIKSIYDLPKLKEGDVLVSPMTRPDYVVAMKKAAAIVADEGGLLCHAAIVSRELGIPCVVGAKVATKTFKDGDLVEVDAGKGTVRRIE